MCFNFFPFLGSTNTTQENVVGVAQEMNSLFSRLVHVTIKVKTDVSMTHYNWLSPGSTLCFATIKAKVLKEQNLKMQKLWENVWTFQASLRIDHDETFCSGNRAPT